MADDLAEGQAEEGTQAAQAGVMDQADHPEGDGNSQPFLHTWKSKQDTEKGIKEILSQRDRLASQLGDLKQQTQKQDEILAKLAEAEAARSNPNPSEKDVEREYEKVSARLKRALEEQDSDFLMSFYQNAMTDTEKRASQKFAAELQKRDEQLEHLSSRLMDFDPEFVQNRSTITQLAEQTGLDPVKDRKYLMAFAKVLPRKTEQPPKPPIPGSIGGSGRSTIREEEPMSDGDLTQLSGMLGVKLSDAQRKALKGQWRK